MPSVTETHGADFHAAHAAHFGGPALKFGAIKWGGAEFWESKEMQQQIRHVS
jgi:hypothetical protein